MIINTNQVHVCGRCIAKTIITLARLPVNKGKITRGQLVKHFLGPNGNGRQSKVYLAHAAEYCRIAGLPMVTTLVFQSNGTHTQAELDNMYNYAKHCHLTKGLRQQQFILDQQRLSLLIDPDIIQPC